MAVYKNRNLAPKGDTWDIQSFLDGKTTDQWIALSLKIGRSLVKKLNNRLDNLENFHAFHVELEKFSQTVLRVGEYLNLACAEDTLSPLSSKLAEFHMKLQPYQEALASLDAEDIKSKSKIEKYLQDDRLARWRRQYEILFKKAEHVLPERIAHYASKVSDAFANNIEFFTVLTDAELKHERAKDSKGKKHEVSSQTIMQLLLSEDRVLRQNAYLSYERGWLLYKETLSVMLSNHFMAGYRLAQAANYQNQIHESLDSDNVKPDLVISLYQVAKQNLGAFKRIARAKRVFVAKKMSISYEKVEPFDMRIELVGVKKVYTLEQAKKNVLDSVSLLGQEYVSVVKKAFGQRWVDFHMTPNKTSGAFSAGIWGVEKKVILMNFSGDLSSVSTLAHEMGHSMHSYYNHTSNDYQHGSYPIFIAEVASIFSELMLTEHILENEKDPAVQFRFLGDFLENFAGSVFFQLQFSEYEFRIVESIEKGTPLTNFADLSKAYEKVALDYKVNRDWEKKYPEFQTTRAVSVPHYYLGFYVYKYAIGMIGALHLMSQIKEDKVKGVANYLNFIRSGNQEWPADILKRVGVDLYDPKALKKAFDLYSEYAEKYISLGKKLLKINAKI